MDTISIGPAANQVLSSVVPGASVFPNEREYQVKTRLTVGEIAGISTKLLLVSYTSVYNVDNCHCE